MAEQNKKKKKKELDAGKAAATVGGGVYAGQKGYKVIKKVPETFRKVKSKAKEYEERALSQIADSDYFSGDKKVKRKTINKSRAEAGKEFAKDTFAKGKEKAKAVTGKVKDKAVSGFNKTKAGVKTTFENTKNRTVGQNAKHAAGQAWKGTKKAASAVGKFATKTPAGRAALAAAAVGGTIAAGKAVKKASQKRKALKERANDNAYVKTQQKREEERLRRGN